MATTHSIEYKNPLSETNFFVLMNSTKVQYINSYADKEEALKDAQKLAHAYPTQRFLVLAPSANVFQPANVQVEAIAS